MKWVAVFFNQGGWKVKGVREGFHELEEQPSRPNTFVSLDRLIIVDEAPSAQEPPPPLHLAQTPL
ncbi:hypothetical protein HaLaN_06099 [Haematococcus lacustris]|uniref:Uncharacterized protein n=1 Tax=Haematococcus lacustris TaxID=44745 RepID=A0A699YKX5_HAELA|nr:hypothetical protein HaLaN_06099 [Haematococcus lacustris]